MSDGVMNEFLSRGITVPLLLFLIQLESRIFRQNKQHHFRFKYFL